ncbi:MAG: OmpH family outer membrane protein [Verrucomicrobiota bacterium]
MRTIVPAVLLLAFFSGSALAQTKIATVDLGNTFTNYYKTKLAQAAIQDRATQLAKDDKGMKDDLKKASDEYQQLLQQANDQSISAGERARRQQAAADKLKQLEERRTAIDEYERQAQATLNDQKLQMREKILARIQTTVNTVAKAGGYTLVIDKSAQAASVTPVVVYSVPEIDLTADVLKQLNDGAPIDMTPASSAPVVSPVPSLLNTNSP